MFDSPKGGQRRIKFTNARELALRWPSDVSTILVGSVRKKSVLVPSQTEYMTVTSQRNDRGEVGVTGFYKDYDRSIRKIDGEFSNRAIGAMIRGRRGMEGLAKVSKTGRRAKTLSRKRALEVFGEPLYGSMSPTPKFKESSVSELAPKRVAKARTRTNPTMYLPSGISLHGARHNPSRSFGSRGFGSRRNPMGGMPHLRARSSSFGSRGFGSRRNPAFGSRRMNPMGSAYGQAASILARSNPTMYLPSGLGGYRMNPMGVRRRRVRR
jgi:hypothetical protein